MNTLNVKCPLCGGNIIENTKAFSCENWPKSKKECKFTIWKESYGAVFTEDDVKKLVDGEAVEKINISKDGRPYPASWSLSSDYKQVFERITENEG